jgi:hypothetical protein
MPDKGDGKRRSENSQSRHTGSRIAQDRFFTQGFSSHQSFL